MALAPESIYSILNGKRLRELAAVQGPIALQANQRWVQGWADFIAGRERGLDLPILFADAALDCSKLIYWGTVTRVEVTDSGTDYSVVNLVPIRGRKTQELVLVSTGKPIAEGYLKAYAIVRTPDFVRQAAERLAVASPVTLFSFGYWGCGSATPELVRAIDAAELLRGYQPPLWVDIRIQRSVRAVGFKDDAFQRLLGTRYRWMPDLGNVGVRDGGSLRIKDPRAARALLELALEEPSRRVIFFCACETLVDCHRREIARLLHQEAFNRGVHAAIVEWPGGKPGDVVLEVNVPPAVLRQIVGGSRKTVPVPANERGLIAQLAALAWGSAVKLRADGETHTILVGPARFGTGGSYLPILTWDALLAKAGFGALEA